MAVWAKTVLAFAVMLMPGGLALLFAYALGRALYSAYVAAKGSGAEIHYWDLVTGLHFRDILREARATL